MEHAQTCPSPPDVVAVMTQSFMTQQPASPPDVYSIAVMQPCPNHDATTRIAFKFCRY
jgi:hypothetical protein